MKAKKNINLHPPPLNNKKKRKKKSRCTLSLSHNEFVKKITPFPSLTSPQ
jgi:hypothetical protein